MNIYQRISFIVHTKICQDGEFSSFLCWILKRAINWFHNDTIKMHISESITNQLLWCKLELRFAKEYYRYNPDFNSWFFKSWSNLLECQDQCS